MSAAEQPQHMVALANANKVRLARATLKRRVRAGEVDVADLLEPGETIPAEAEAMATEELLFAQHRWGSTRVRKLLNWLAISGRRPVGELTDRQRDRLVTALRGGTVKDERYIRPGVPL